MKFKVQKPTAIILLFLLFVGCENSIDKKREMERDEQILQNIMSRNIALLSIKYSIDEQILKKVIFEYEKMIYGISKSEFIMKEKMGLTDSVLIQMGSSADSQIVTTPVAVAILSSKYNIPQQVLAQILIEYRIHIYTS